jgi:hypothetical protein
VGFGEKYVFHTIANSLKLQSWNFSKHIDGHYFFSFQFCDVVQVVIVHKYIYQKNCDIKNMKV